MAGRAGGGRGQQERAEGNRKQAKTEKKGGRENESKTLTTAVTIWQQTHAPTMVPIMPILDDVDPWKDSPCTSMCLQGESPLRCGFPNRSCTGYITFSVRCNRRSPDDQRRRSNELPPGVASITRDKQEPHARQKVRDGRRFRVWRPTEDKSARCWMRTQEGPSWAVRRRKANAEHLRKQSSGCPVHPRTE